jgi:hypothetical protein
LTGFTRFTGLDQKQTKYVFWFVLLFESCQSC